MTNYPCLNHPDRVAFVECKEGLLCYECYIKLRRPEIWEYVNGKHRNNLRGLAGSDEDLSR